VQWILSNPSEDAGWNDRLAALGGASFFNTAEWSRVLSASYGYEPCHVVGREGGTGVSLLPLMQVRSRLTGCRGISLPFSDCCEPAGLGGSRQGELLAHLRALGRERGWRYFELRNAGVLGNGLPLSARYWQHTLDLAPGEERLFGGLEGGVRTAIRKALKSGVEVSFSRRMEAVLGFYRLHCRTRRRHGLPPQPPAFFRHLQREVLDRGLGFVVTAWHEGRAVAAAVFCHYGTGVIFKYGASDRRRQATRGSTLMMWEAIRRCVREGFGELSLGRTARGDAGLRRYKLGWGARESELGYVRYDFRRDGFVEEEGGMADPGYALVRALPLSCSRLIGTLLYKHFA
jgi:hypothetical protein